MSYDPKAPRKQVLVPPSERVFKKDLPPVHDIKKLVVFNKPGTALYAVGFDKGGPVPKELECLFTREDLAERAIQRYMKVENG